MPRVLLQIYCWVQLWKKFLNRPTFLKVMNEYPVARYYGRLCTLNWSLIANMSEELKDI